MKNLKLHEGQSLRVSTPNGDVVIQVSAPRTVVGDDLSEQHEPMQVLYYTITKDGKDSGVMELL